MKGGPGPASARGLRRPVAVARLRCRGCHRSASYSCGAGGCCCCCCCCSSDKITKGRRKRWRGGRWEVMGWSNHRIPNGLRVIKIDLHHDFGEAQRLATKLNDNLNHGMRKIGRWISAQFKCVGSLGWDFSGSYHVLQLISSLTSRSTAIRKGVGFWIVSSNYYAHHIIQQKRFHHNPAKVGIHLQRLTLKTGKDVWIVIFLKPARRALRASGNNKWTWTRLALRHRIQSSQHEPVIFKSGGNIMGNNETITTHY